MPWQRETLDGFEDCLVLREGRLRLVLYIDGREWASATQVDGSPRQIFHGTTLPHVVEMAPERRDDAIQIHRAARDREAVELRRRLARSLSALRRGDSATANAILDEIYPYNLERLDSDLARALGSEPSPTTEEADRADT